METSEIMENSEMTEILTEETPDETTSIQETTEMLMTTETTLTTTTECLTLSTSKLDGLNVDRINDFTYLGIFFIIFCILLIVFRGLNRILRIFI